MTNPILQALNAARPQIQNSNNLLGRVAEIRQVLNGQAPEAVFNRMLQTNPAFAQFVQQNKGKTPEQLARDYGIDPQLIQQILK